MRRARETPSGGRLRWKIENEGFNIQKNSGFNLEHARGIHDRQMKNFYLLPRIAHLLLQLTEKGNLFRCSAARLFGSLENLARRLSESFRNHLISPDALDAAAPLAQGPTRSSDLVRGAPACNASPGVLASHR